jgi:hypothetical protein
MSLRRWKRRDRGEATVPASGGYSMQDHETLELVVHRGAVTGSGSAVLMRSLWVPNRGLKRVPLSPIGAPPFKCPPRPAGVREEVWLTYWGACSMFTRAERFVIEDSTEQALIEWLEDAPPA